MPLTPTQLAICAAIFSAGVATPAVVHKVRPAIKHQSKKVAQHAPLHKARPITINSVPANKGPAILDCPVAVPSISYPVSVSSITDTVAAPYGSGGGWMLPYVQPPIFSPGAAVPEPSEWVMLFGGLALTGVAMRRRACRARFKSLTRAPYSYPEPIPLDMWLSYVGTSLPRDSNGAGSSLLTKP